MICRRRNDLRREGLLVMNRNRGRFKGIFVSQTLQGKLRGRVPQLIYFVTCPAPIEWVPRIILILNPDNKKATLHSSNLTKVKQFADTLSPRDCYLPCGLYITALESVELYGQASFNYPITRSKWVTREGDTREYWRHFATLDNQIFHTLLR